MDYCTDDVPSRNLVEEWLIVEGAQVQAEFDNVVNILQATKDWTGLREFLPLTKRHVGLAEIRFHLTTTEKRIGPFWRYRPVGFLRPERREFVFLLGAKKWMEVYTPLDAFDQALALKEKFENGRGTIHEHIF